MKNRPVDALTGKPIRKLWIMNTSVKPEDKVLARRKRKATLWGGAPLASNWTENVWTGRYLGYGNDGKGIPLFNTMKNAVIFASAAYRAGYRIKQ